MTTQAAKSKQVPPPDEPYTNIEMRLVCASKIRVRNGEHAGKVIDWDATMLRVYLYLFNQVKGFESKEGMFYQSQKKIWLSTNIGKTKLNEVLSALKILGLITDTGEREKVNGAPRGLVKLTASRLTDVIENLEIDFADFDGEPVWDHQRASGKKRSKSYVQKADSSKQKSTMQAAPQAQQEPPPQDNADEPAPNEDATPNIGDCVDQSDPPFPLVKTVSRAIATLDDLRYWSDIGYEGMNDYGVMWGVSGDDLEKLIGEHLKIREAQAEKNFKLQRTN